MGQLRYGQIVWDFPLSTWKQNSKYCSPVFVVVVVVVSISISDMMPKRKFQKD